MFQLRSKGRYKGTRSKGGYKGRGQGIWQVDGEYAHGNCDGNQLEEEKPASKEANVVDPDGYQVVRRNRVLGNYMPEIFAVGRFIDRELEIVQILLGSTGSRIKAPVASSSLSARTTSS